MSERLASDVMTDWMRVTRTFGIVLARNLLPARWAIEIEAREGSAFHYVPRGHASIRVGTTTLELAEGDLVVVSRGTDSTPGEGADCGDLDLPDEGDGGPIIIQKTSRHYNVE